MKTAVVSFLVSVLLCLSFPVQAGPLGDRCAYAFEAERVVKARLRALESFSGDRYDMEIKRLEIGVVRAILREPQKIIERSCSV